MFTVLLFLLRCSVRNPLVPWLCNKMIVTDASVVTTQKLRVVKYLCVSACHILRHYQAYCLNIFFFFFTFKLILSFKLLFLYPQIVPQVMDWVLGLVVLDGDSKKGPAKLHEYINNLKTGSVR
jgi:hypothetical protein